MSDDAGKAEPAAPSAVALLRRFMGFYGALAVHFRPSRADDVNESADDKAFRYWSERACDVAKALLAYEAPKLGAIMPPAPEAGERVTRFKLDIFDRELPRIELRREPGSGSFVVEGTGSEQ